jgi:hypothetical protein
MAYIAGEEDRGNTKYLNKIGWEGKYQTLFDDNKFQQNTSPTENKCCLQRKNFLSPILKASLR